MTTTEKVSNEKFILILRISTEEIVWKMSEKGFLYKLKQNLTKIVVKNYVETGKTTKKYETFNQQ